MKIAFIDHLPLGTGIPRMATSLAKALVQLDGNVELTYFTHAGTYHTNKDLYICDSPRFKVIILDASFPEKKIKAYSRKLLRLPQADVRKRFQKEISQIRGFDVVYFTAAHMSPFYEVEGKRFATFHDFNWKYSFGLPNFRKQDVDVFNGAMPSWFRSTVPIVSSHFVKKEIEKFYPAHKYPVEVVYLPNIGAEVQDETRSLFDFPYILYPANLFPHKNHLQLFRALFLLKQQDKLGPVKLVLTGGGTDHFKYSTLTFAGIEQSTEDDFDVVGMGYVSNKQIDSLIKNALLNLSASLYEAGSGPAIDAWINKVPFLMSDIPSHRDQLRRFELECILFDPYNPYDIAEKIQYALEHREEMKEMALKGYHALKKNNWEIAAGDYLSIFRKYSDGN